MAHHRNKSLPANFSCSSPLAPLFTENTRVEFERHMSNERRAYDSSTPSYSLNGISMLQSQQRSQPNQHNLSSSEARQSNSVILDTDEFRSRCRS